MRSRQSLRMKIRSVVSVLLTSIIVLTSVIPFSFAEDINTSDENDISSDVFSEEQESQNIDVDSTDANDQISDGNQNDIGLVESVNGESVNKDKIEGANENENVNDKADNAAQSTDAVAADNETSGDVSEKIDSDEEQQDEESFIDRLIDKTASLLGLDGTGWEGNGSESNPYKIATRNDLMLLAEKVNDGESYAGKYFVLVNNIDTTVISAEDKEQVNVQDSGSEDANLSADDTAVTETPEAWTPIGTTAKKPFKGHFDGAGNQ